MNNQLLKRKGREKMKLGIIIICHNNENEIDKDFYFKYSNKIKELEICLVNNESNDNTNEILKVINEQCERVSVVNVKKKKSDISAVKAGARYMFNQFNIEHLGYVTCSNSTDMKVLIEAIKQNLLVLINLNIALINQSEIKPTKFQRLFSITDYLSRINAVN